MRKEELRGRYENALADLHRLRDEIRLEVHLATLDVRDKWTELEKKGRELESRAVSAERRAEETTLKALDELIGKLGELRQGLKSRRKDTRPGA